MRSRKRRENLDVLIDDIENFMLYGRALFLGVIPRNRPSMEDLKLLWEQNRDVLLAIWQEKEPAGSVPFAEYYFQQDEPRDFNRILLVWELGDGEEEIEL
jgi:hypothetical protein